jgi:hypothetical protein
MKRVSALLVLCLAFGCQKTETAPEAVPDHERAAPEPGAPLPDADLRSADVAAVRHREWKIGETDTGQFSEVAAEARREPQPRNPNRTRNVPQGLIHRYDFTVLKNENHAIFVVHQSTFQDERATPVMALFRDDGTRDKVKIPLELKDTPDGPFELPELATGLYELEDGFGLIAKDLQPGPYVLLVKPTQTDAFSSRQRGAAEEQRLADSHFICMSECVGCK